MQNKLFLLDGMALVYRAHFALMARPIFTSKGVNTSALYGFTQTLLDILKTSDHPYRAEIDTSAPTHRDKAFAEYKAHRQAMPEDITQPQGIRANARRLQFPVLTCDGYEAMM